MKNIKENTMSETITIEAVSNKFSNKYSSGSVKVGDKWMQVAKNIDIDAFQKGSQMTSKSLWRLKQMTKAIRQLSG